MKILRKVYEGFGPENLDLDLGITDIIDIDSNIIPEFFDPCVFSSQDQISEDKGVHCTEFREDCITFGFDAESVTFLNNSFSITESMGKYQSDSPSLVTPNGSPVRSSTFEPISEPADLDLDELMGDVYEIGAEVSPEKDCFLPVCEVQEEEEQEAVEEEAVGGKVGSSTDTKTDPQIFIPDNNNDDLMKEPNSTTTVVPSELDDYIKNNIQQFNVEDMITDDFYEEVNYNNNNNFSDDTDLFAVLISNSTALINETDQKTENNNDTTTTTENAVPEKNQDSIVQLKTDSDDTKSPAIINSLAATTTTKDHITSSSSITNHESSELQPKVVLKRISQEEIDKALSSKKIYDLQIINYDKKGKLSTTPTEPPKRRGRPRKTPTSTTTPINTSINKTNNNSSSSSRKSTNKKRKREESESENTTDNSVQEIEYKNETPMVPTTRTNARINPKSEPNRTFGMESSEDNTGRVGRRRCFTVAPASSSSVISVQEMVDKRFKSREAETPRSSLDNSTRAHRYGLRNRNT